MRALTHVDSPLREMVLVKSTPSVPDYDRLHNRDPGGFAAPPQLKELLALL